MADTNSDQKPRRRPPRYHRFRPLVQAGFLAVWMAPIAALRSFPGCVFHCYACPLASFACPVGVTGQLLAAGMVPLLAVGVVLAAAALFGSLVCGWACPFGFIQDLLAKIPSPKFRLPNWTGYGRYLVLIGAVVLVPLLWGTGHPLFVCRICPAGAVQGGLGQITARAVRTGQIQNLLSVTKWVILGVFLLAAVLTLRPWCKVLCPLGGFLGLFNPVSVFHLRFDRRACTECNTCRSRCPMGVKVEKKTNVSNCIRCMECTSCGAILPAADLPARRGEAAERGR